MEENSGKFRKHKTKFAQVSNSALQNENLSLRAKGLYSLIQSYITMPNYTLYKRKLLKQCKEKEKAFDKPWKELKDAGYLKIYRKRCASSNKYSYEYDLLEEADLSTPSLINIGINGKEIPPKVNEPPQNEGSSNNEVPEPPQNQKGSNENTDTNEPPQNGHGSDEYCSTGCHSNELDSNGSSNNNTCLNNTDVNNTKSISQSEQDRQTDQLREKLKEQIEYPFFELNFNNDLLAVDVLVNYMVELLTSPTTVINGIPQSNTALEPYIAKVDSSTIQEFLQHMHEKELRNIKKPLLYWRSAFVNYLRETELIKAAI